MSVVANLGYALAYAERMNLAAMAPRGDLSATGYALANPVATGAEYLVYAPNGGTFAVDLRGTTEGLRVEWFNPSNGTTVAGPGVTGGAMRSFRPPFGGDAVLYLFQTTTPTATRTGSATAMGTATATNIAVATATGTPTPAATNTPAATLTGTATPTATPLPQIELFLKRIGQGSVFPQPAGPYYPNQSVAVAASADPGWQFVGWTCAIDSQENPLSLMIMAPLTITAHFQQIVTLPPPPTDPYTLLLLSMRAVASLAISASRTRISLPTTGQLENGHSFSTVPQLGWQVPTFTRWHSQATTHSS